MIRQNNYTEVIRPIGPYCSEPHPHPHQTKIEPLVSVKSVNGMDGDIVLEELKIGEKIYNGSEKIKILPEDLSLERAIQYATSFEIEDLEEVLTNAKARDLYFCNSTKTFYLILEDGNYIQFPSTEALENYHDIAKQDKLIAGKNITIDEATNTISTTATATIGEDLVTTRNVGCIPKGTIISADTPISELLKDIFNQPHVYFGIVDKLPTKEVDDLQALPQTVETLLTEGFATQVVTDNQYAILVIDKSLDIECTEVKVGVFNLEYFVKDFDTQLVYYFEEPTTETLEDEIIYEYTFARVE